MKSDVLTGLMLVYQVRVCPAGIGGAAQIETGHICGCLQSLPQEKQALKDRGLPRVVTSKDNGKWS